MIEITKSEACIVREHFPNACIAKTRHKRFLEESEAYLSLIPNNVEAAALLARMKEKNYRRKKYNNAVKKTQEKVAQYGSN